MLGVAVLGLGWWGSKLLRNVVSHSLCGHALGVDLLSNRCNEISETFHVKTESDPDNVFVDPAIDAVIIATPPATHFKLARSAFASGKDVLVTKPPTQTTEELKTLIRLANHHHRIFMMDSTFVYSTPIRKIKDLLDNGLFPNIRFIQSLRYGDDLRLHHVSRLRNTMLANKINVIQDLLFHDIAILNYLLPEKDLKLRAVHTVNMLAENICDTAFIHLDTDIFPIHVGLSWTIPDRRRELLISDKEKLLIFDDLKPDNKLTLFWIEEKREEVIEHGKEEPLFMVVDHFLKCVQKRTTPITDGTYMLNVMKSFQSIIDFSQ